MPPVTPYLLVFEGPYRPRPRESLLYLRQYFDTVRPSEVLQNSQFFMFPIFDLSCAFTISDQLMHWLPADRMAALGAFG